jgi:hypothetical protein
VTAALSDQRQRVAQGLDLGGHHELEPDPETVLRAQCAQGGELVGEPGRVRVVPVHVDPVSSQVGGALDHRLEVLDRRAGLEAAGSGVEQGHAGNVQAPPRLPPHPRVACHRETAPVGPRELEHQADGSEARLSRDIDERGRLGLDQREMAERERVHAAVPSRTIGYMIHLIG